MKNEDRPELVDVQEMCELTEYSRATLYRFIAMGMPSIKLGKYRYFDLYASSAWLGSHDQPIFFS